MIIVCIPAHNEEENIKQVITDIKKAMEPNQYEYEIHVQDDGSTDRTKEIAESCGAVVFSNKENLGLAKTFREELKNAKGADVIVHTDADNQYKAKYIPALIKKLAEGNDLVLGSRFLDGNNYSGSPSKGIGNKLFTMLISFIAGKKFTDVTTGFRAFNQKVASLRLIDDFTYTYEQLIRTSKANFKIAEVPIETNATRESRLFKSPIDYATKASKGLWKIWRDK